MLGDMMGDAPKGPKSAARGRTQEVSNEMIDFTSFDTSNYDSNKRRRGGFDAFDAPPPSAAMMDFDADGDVAVKEEPVMSEEEKKMAEEIEELERQSRLAKLKKQLEAKRNGEELPDAELEAKTPSGPSMAQRAYPDTKTPAPAAGGMDHITPRTHKTAKVDSTFWENQQTEATGEQTAAAPAMEGKTGPNPTTPNSFTPEC